MPHIDAALVASRDAVEELITAAERKGAAWTTPQAAGKWSPSQIVEHVARSLEESANVANGRASKFPNLPGLIRPLVRGLLFRRVIRTGAFPKARTNKAMNPSSGPSTPSEGRRRLEDAHRQFETACRDLTGRGGRMRTTVFGEVAVEDYVRFMELHTRHHGKQVV